MLVWTLNEAILHRTSSKKIPTHAEAVRSYGVSQRRARRLLQQNRNVCFYRSVRDPRLELRTRMREIAHTRALWVSTRAHPAAPRRLAGGLEARLSTVQGRAVAVTQQAAQAPQDGDATRRAVCCDAAWSSLGDGFRGRSTGGRSQHPCVDRRRGLQPQGAGDHSTAGRARRCDIELPIGATRSPKVAFTDNSSEFTGRLLDLWAYHH